MTALNLYERYVNVGGYIKRVEYASSSSIRLCVHLDNSKIYCYP
jgi:hypothetical protein